MVKKHGQGLGSAGSGVPRRIGGKGPIENCERDFGSAHATRHSLVAAGDRARHRPLLPQT